MRCRICDNELGNVPVTAKETMFGTGKCFPYFQCAQCQCLQIATIPKDISQYYPDNYYAYQEALPTNSSSLSTILKKKLVAARNRYALFGKGFVRHPLGRTLYQQRPNLELRALQPLALSRDQAILDVGSGHGALLAHLALIGFHNIAGLDPFLTEAPGPITQARSFPIWRKTLFELEESWDVIMFHHSFEHMPEPEKVLRRAGELLKPGGHCLLRLPTVSSHAWQHYGTDWVQLDAPRHFFLFSIASLNFLAARAGFSITGINYDSTAFQFWGSEQCRRGIALHGPRSWLVDPRKSLFSTKEMAEFQKKAEALNEQKDGDQMVVYLQRMGNST